VRVLRVQNEFFGGNIGVAGLLTGADLIRALAAEPESDRYLLADACLSEGRFLDGLTLDDLPRAVEVVPADGRSLRLALDAFADGSPAQAAVRGPVPAADARAGADAAAEVQVSTAARVGAGVGR
jgi:hypothetical protein